MGLGVPGGSVCSPMQVRAVQGCSQPATELGGARLKAQACAGALQGLLHTRPQGEWLSWPWVVTQPLPHSPEPWLLWSCPTGSSLTFMISIPC